MTQLILLAIVVAVVAVIAIVVHRQAKASFQAALLQLETEGHVITRAQERHRGAITWIWGRYAQPVPFYLRASNRDLIAAAIGQLGVADLKVGHEVFDRLFFVRSHHPNWARAFLTPARCEKLLAAGQVDFIVSSIDNLLSPDYFPDALDRNLREIWMLRIDGHPQGEVLEKQVALARELAAALESFSAGLAHSSDDLRAGSFEGR